MGVFSVGGLTKRHITSEGGVGELKTMHVSVHTNTSAHRMKLMSLNKTN